MNGGYKVNNFLKQRGSTCGFYALVNAIIHYEKIENIENEEEIHKMILNLIKKHANLEDKAHFYTFIGEFFDTRLFSNFINKIEPFSFLEKNYHIESQIVDFNKNLQDGIYLIPIYGKRVPAFSLNVVSHWICVFVESGKFKIINSTSKKVKYVCPRKIQEQYNALKNRTFSWKCYKNKYRGNTPTHKWSKERIALKNKCINEKIIPLKIKYEVVGIIRLNISVY